MSELGPECIPPPAAVPPEIDPHEFDRYPTFRETFLLFVADCVFRANPATDSDGKAATHSEVKAATHSDGNPATF